jgi:hypothetical protein
MSIEFERVDVEPLRLGRRMFKSEFFRVEVDECTPTH